MELRGGTGYKFFNTNINTLSNSGGYQLWTDYSYIDQALQHNFNIPLTSLAVTSRRQHGGDVCGRATSSAAGGLGLGAIGTVLSTSCGIILNCSNSTPTVGAGTNSGLATACTGGPLANQLTVTGLTITGAGSTGWIVFSRTPLNYPINDQVGVGPDVSGVSTGVAGAAPAYSWGEKFNSSSWARTQKSSVSSPINPTAIYTAAGFGSFSDNSVVKTDRDIFTDLTYAHTTTTISSGVGTGTTAAMNVFVGPNTTGVGFWVTDQGTWNNSGGPQGLLYERRRDLDLGI